MKRKKIVFALLFVALLFGQAAAQTEFNVSNFTGAATLGIGNFEPVAYQYDFIAPLESSRICKNGEQMPATATNQYVAFATFCTNPALYTPSFEERYFISVFGPRMRASGSDISEVYDFHRGEDIVDGDSPPLSSTDLPTIQCMCDGYVHEIRNGSDAEMEQTEEGRYVTVRCNAKFNGSESSMGHIYIAYRHLSRINPRLAVGNPISKGAIIGIMGSSGRTEINHLHLSAQKKLSNGRLINVHPMRLFNPAINRHLLTLIDAPPVGTTDSEQKKERVNLFLLSTNADTALIRIAVPYKKANIRAIIIKKGSFTATVDFEKISQDRDGNTNWLNDPVVNNMKLYVFPFNRGQSAYSRFDKIRTDLAVEAPEHTGNQHPISNTGIFTSPAYVLDVKAAGLPSLTNTADLEVYLIDVWGRAVKGTL